MQRMLKSAAALFAYACAAAVLGQIGIGGYLWSSGKLDRQKLADIAAVAAGAKLGSDKPDSTGPAPAILEQKSHDDLAALRAVKTRDLELREQALETSVAVVKSEYEKLFDERDRYERIKLAFKNQLDELRAGPAAANRENVRLMLESMKPKQAKDHILRMVKDGDMEDVVLLFSEMSSARRTKIITEFTTDEEATTLAEILKLIREGVPESTLIDGAKKQVERPTPGEPETRPARTAARADDARVNE